MLPLSFIISFKKSYYVIEALSLQTLRKNYTFIRTRSSFHFVGLLDVNLTKIGQYKRFFGEVVITSNWFDHKNVV